MFYIIVFNLKSVIVEIILGDVRFYIEIILNPLVSLVIKKSFLWDNYYISIVLFNFNYEIISGYWIS